jgi:hypothetical protein
MKMDILIQSGKGMKKELITYWIQFMIISMFIILNYKEYYLESTKAEETDEHEGGRIVNCADTFIK